MLDLYVNDEVEVKSPAIGLLGRSLVEHWWLLVLRTTFPN